MNRSQTPPQGWAFFEPSTNWWVPDPVAWTFDQVVTMIIKHRLANPATTAKHRLATDPVSVGSELEAFTRKRLNLPEMPLPKIQPPPQAPPYRPVVVGAIEDIKKIAAGAGLLMEWEESGLPPVPAELSAQRAAVCQACPKNSQKEFGQWFTGPVAGMFRAKLARLNQMNMTTPSDPALGTCAACLCPLRLKVHTPISLIEKRLKPEARAELHVSCWILSETQH